MEKANSLSKRLDWKVEVVKDNENEILVKPEQLKVRKAKKVEVIVEEVDLLEKVRKSKIKDNEVVKAVEEIKQARVKILKDKEQREVDGIIYIEEKVYILKDDILRAEIIRLYHDIPVEGHRGQQKIVELVTQNFWQPGVTKEMKQYVEGYDSYQKNKNYTKQPAGKLISNLISKKPWTHILADFITKLPLVQEYNLILVVVDRLTKIVYLISTIKRISAEGLARLFRDNVQKLYGLPESIISDRGPKFVAGLMRELNKILEIESKISTVFYLQGQIEKVNQELEQQPDWSGMAEFAYNNKAYSSTKTSFFKANYRQDLLQTLFGPELWKYLTNFNNLNDHQKPLRRPFKRYQKHLKAISIH